MKAVPYTREAVAAKLLDQPAYDKFTREHIGILLSLPERGQDAVLERVRAIANSIPGMGAVAALIAEVRRLRSAMRETFVQGAIYERARTTACGPQPANGYLANLARCEAFRRWPDGEVSDD